MTAALMTSGPVREVAGPDPRPDCAEPGCPRAAQRRGVCRAHHDRYGHGSTCGEAGCGRDAGWATGGARGRCARHYRRWLRQQSAAAVDEVAVDRACQGDRTVPLTRAERLAAVARLDQQGFSARAAADRLGCTPRTVQRLRATRRTDRRTADRAIFSYHGRPG